MKIIWYALFLLTVLAGCKDKKVSLNEEDDVEVGDFIEFYPEIKLPYQIADTALLNKPGDSSVISRKIFNKFIPDSVLVAEFGKAGKPQLYSLGRTSEKGKETYLFTKAIQGKKRVGYMSCFDKDDKYLSSMPIVRTGFETLSNSYGSLDKKFQITTYKETKRADGATKFKRNIYIYNSSANTFTLILTEPNEEVIENVINPIDTFSQKKKYTGDYVQNKKNIVSFRDSKRDGEVLFFIHFEKDNAQCNGELKGEAKFISPTMAQYRQSGNPCAIQFDFTSSSVQMKELEGCGSYRDIKCFFDGKYPKKKDAKAKDTKKKK